MAKIAPTSYPLDEIRAAKSIMCALKRNPELLLTYIKAEVIPRFERANITEYEKTFNGMISAIDKHIADNTVSFTVDFSSGGESEQQ